MATQKNTSSQKEARQRLWDMAYKVALIVAIALIGVSIRSQVLESEHAIRISNLEARIEYIEGNRWTDADDLRSREAMKAWIEARYPPDSVVQAIKELKQLVLKLDDRLRALESK